MLGMHLASEVRDIIDALYGPSDWDRTLAKCRAILTADNAAVFESDVRGRLRALGMAGHNEQALMAVAAALGVEYRPVREMDVLEARIVTR